MLKLIQLGGLQLMYNELVPWYPDMVEEFCQTMDIVWEHREEAEEEDEHHVMLTETIGSSQVYIDAILNHETFLFPPICTEPPFEDTFDMKRKMDYQDKGGREKMYIHKKLGYHGKFQFLDYLLRSTIFSEKKGID